LSRTSLGALAAAIRHGGLMATATVGLRVTEAGPPANGRRVAAAVGLALVLFGLGSASWPHGPASSPASPHTVVTAVSDDDGHADLLLPVTPLPAMAVAPEPTRADAAVEKVTPLDTAETATLQPRAPPSS
jgi:hypothetical protein